MNTALLVLVFLLPLKVFASNCIVPEIENGQIAITSPIGNLSAASFRSHPSRVAPFSRLTIVCQSGYRLSASGSSKAFCEETGDWLPNELATCPDMREFNGDCGVSVTSRVFGGSYAAAGEFPWMVKIDITVVGLLKPQSCGGSLLSRNWVLTAGHCVSQQEIASISLVVGHNNLSAATNRSQQIRNSAKIIVHPNYNAENYESDYALIKLHAPVEFSTYVRPICLPDNLCNPDSALVRRTAEFDSCVNGRDQLVAAGWGTTQNGLPTDSLKMINLTLYSRAECERLSRFDRITENQICAGVPGVDDQDTCHGDSGGPLMCVKSGKAYVLGIVSYGLSQCGLADKPSVYSRVCSVIDWIKGHINNSLISTTTLSTARLRRTTIKTSSRARPTTTETMMRTPTQPQRCESPLIANANMTKLGRKLPPRALLSVGEVISISCSDGFLMVDDIFSTLTCHRSALMTPDLPEGNAICVEQIGCSVSRLPKISNGTINISSEQAPGQVLAVGTFGIIICRSGFIVEGPVRINCDSNGNWSSAGNCKPGIRVSMRTFFEAVRTGQLENVKQMIYSNIDANFRNSSKFRSGDWIIQNSTALIALAANCKELTGPNVLGNYALELMKILLANNTSARVIVNAKEAFYGHTALIAASFNCRMPQGEEIIRFLVTRGAKVTDRNSGGFTALLAAAESGKVEVVRFLLSQGASVHDKSNTGYSALIQAARANSTASVRLLLDRGANINEENEFGLSALSYAAWNNFTETAQLLVNRGASKEGCNYAVCRRRT